MKRKYFSRGLGLGILVTALLFAFGLLFYKPSLSDEEIKARATLLGMTETSDRRTSSETSAASSATSSASSAANSSSASSAVPASSAEPETSATSAEETPKPSEDPAPLEPSPSEPEPSEPTPVEPEPSPSPETPTPSVPDTPPEPSVPDVPGGNTDDTGLLSVTISPQETSLKVSENLYRAGIIDDPVSFNKFLESNGYDYNIQTGTYWISPNASYETIAHAITNI